MFSISERDIREFHLPGVILKTTVDYKHRPRGSILMQQTSEQNPTFVDRRSNSDGSNPGQERRQFSSSHQTLRPEVIELAEAVDQYKLRHRRRFITFEELYDVMAELGYHR